MTAKFSPGSVYHDFETTKVTAIGEINARLLELTHLPTGARIMHLQNDDEDNLFCLAFQTLPNNSNGAPHILEHTVLCGSKKFPVKDPFFSMRRRSMATFMNAMTGSDFTCYPASSLIKKDFYNLLSIYIDAVFHPLLKKESFMQEAHRLEFMDPKDPHSPLIYKGVVYNEMKGAMSSPDARIYHKTMTNLMPDLPYAHNSGGEPKEIPSLTYQGLLEFHKYFYHPSNCLFFFYGNLPTEEHLDFIEKRALKNVSRTEPLLPLPKQKRFSSPVFPSGKYPLPAHIPTEKKTLVSLSFLTCPITDQEEALAITLLDTILMENDSSFLKQALLKSGLAAHVESALDLEISEIPWMLFCHDCPKDAKKQIYKIVIDTLNDLIKKKIPAHLIDAALHQLEFAKSEITGGRTPYGLTLFFRSALIKQHGGDAEKTLCIHSLFKSLREKIAKQNYLEILLQKYFINNPHYVLLDMQPDHNLGKEEELEERMALDQIRSHLHADKKQAIIKQAEDLANYQKELSKQSLDCLPILHMDDLSPALKEYPLRESRLGDLELFFHDCFTNSILYADLVFDLPKLEAPDLPLLSLLASILTDVGCGGKTYQATLEKQSAVCGNISAYLSASSLAENSNICRPVLVIRAKALYRNSMAMFDLMHDTAVSPNFNDKERIRELILQHYALLSNTLSQSAIGYALSLAQSNLRQESYLNDEWSGLNYFHFLRGIAEDPDRRLPEIIDRLQALKKRVLPGANPRLVISADEKHYAALTEQKFGALSRLPTQKMPSWQEFAVSQETPLREGRTIASPVAFNCMAFNTISYTHPDAPALLVAAQLFEDIVLHTEIREKGGAYGSGAHFMAMEGSFSFYSYRDPKLFDTIDIFNRAIEVVQKGFSSQQLLEAKLGVLQSIDAPLAPGHRGSTAFFRKHSHQSHALREKFRAKIINLAVPEIISAISKHLADTSRQNIVSFAGEELLHCEQNKFKQPLNILPA